MDINLIVDTPTHASTLHFYPKPKNANKIKITSAKRLLKQNMASERKQPRIWFDILPLAFDILL